VELFGVADRTLGVAVGVMVLVAVALAPALLLGFAVAGPLRSRVDAGYTRAAVLAVCAASAVVLLARSAVG
jgi:uncharacterized protein